jgi:hypothetical protein
VDARAQRQAGDLAGPHLIARIIAQHRRDPIHRAGQRDRLRQLFVAQEIAGGRKLGAIGRIAIAELEIGRGVQRQPIAQDQMHGGRA